MIALFLSGHKTIVIGASLGGLVTNLLACTRVPVDVLISVMYASNTAHLIWNSAIAKYIKEDFVCAGLSFTDLEKVWDVIDPTQYQPQVPKDRILLISGMYDQFITSEDSKGLWTSWGKPECVVLPCGHSGLNVCQKQIMKVINRFLQPVQ